MSDAPKMGFWEKQRKGANQQNERHRPEWYRAAGELGLDYVRILPDAWPADNRDFLIGNADNFAAIKEISGVRVSPVGPSKNHRSRLIVTLKIYTSSSEIERQWM